MYVLETVKSLTEFDLPIFMNRLVIDMRVIVFVRMIFISAVCEVQCFTDISRKTEKNMLLKTKCFANTAY